MIEEFITEQDFNGRSGHKFIFQAVGLGVFVFSLILIEMTDTRFLAPLSLVVPAFLLHIIEYRNYRIWRKELIATGHVTAKRFDELAENRNITRRLYSGKGIVLTLAVLLALSFLSHYLWSQDRELKKYGKETVGIVKEIELTLSGKYSYAFVSYQVDGKVYETSLKINGSYLDSKPTYRIDGNPPVQIGDSVIVQYSAVNPEHNKIIIDKTEK